MYFQVRWNRKAQRLKVRKSKIQWKEFQCEKMWKCVAPEDIKGPAPSARSKHSATLVGEYFYLLGGRNGNLPLKDFWKYHLSKFFFDVIFHVRGKIEGDKFFYLYGSLTALKYLTNRFWSSFRIWCGTWSMSLFLFPFSPVRRVKNILLPQTQIANFRSDLKKINTAICGNGDPIYRISWRQRNLFLYNEWSIVQASSLDVYSLEHGYSLFSKGKSLFKYNISFLNPYKRRPRSSHWM